MESSRVKSCVKGEKLREGEGVLVVAVAMDLSFQYSTYSIHIKTGKNDYEYMLLHAVARG